MTAGKFLLVAHGTIAEIERARWALETGAPSPVTERSERAVVPVANRRLEREAEGGAGGAIAGAALGAIAGPPGMAVGSVLGGVVGAIAGAAVARESERIGARTRELDEQIGVTAGSLGAPNLAHPPAKTGAYSAASAGGGTSSGGEPAEGPLQTPA